MRRTLSLLAAVVMVFWSLAPSVVRGGDEGIQALKGSATGFELKMRILEGSRDKPAQPEKHKTQEDAQGHIGEGLPPLSVGCQL